MRGKIRTVALISSAVLLLSTALGGCGSLRERSESQAQTTVYLITLNENGPYWQPLIASAKQKAEERDIRLIVKSGQPGDSSRPQKMMEMVQEAIDQRADGIAMAALEPDMFDEKAMEAMESGIKVVTYDTDIATEANRLSYVGTNNYEAGKILGEHGAEELKKNGIVSGRLTTVSYSGTAKNMTERYRGLKDGFEETMGDAASQFTWCPWIINDLSVSSAREQLESQMISYPDLQAVFTLGTESVIAGTMEAIRSQKLEDRLYHYGFDYSPSLEMGVEEGLIQGIVNQDSEAIGSMLVDKLADAIEGIEIGTAYYVDVMWLEADDILAYGEKQKDWEN